MEAQTITEALTFDDVLLVPQQSEVVPNQVDTTTRLTRSISLKIPLISAAMDTVTESATAIAMAQAGGLGVIHKNMSIADQAAEVQRVKKFESGVVAEPITLGPDEPLAQADALGAEHGISAFPVVAADGQLVGLLTNRDRRAVSDASRPVRDVMTPRERLVTAQEGVALSDAIGLLHQHRVEKLPVVNTAGQLCGLITIKDIEYARHHPDATKDKAGCLRVAAAIGVGAESVERAAALIDAGVDALCIDTAHGHSKAVLTMVETITKAHPAVEVIAGNVATAEGAVALAKAGAAAVKVGQGPGSICTTRIVSGCGMPQFSAVLDCARALRGSDVALIADGGIKYSGDLVKALAAGAHVVMIGSLFAGTEESPGEVVLYQGRRFKVYRGMGSLSAMARGSRDRYGQADVDEVSKFVPEGIEGQVPYRGPLADTLYQLVGGLRSGMGYVGASNLSALHERARFVRLSGAGLKESHVHDVMITKEAPNYSQ